jgi:arylsulfatase
VIDGNRPNVVLVTVDSLRADHCSFMGYERGTTPALDRMAADGLVFERAIAPGPATPESMPAIFTGQYPVDRGGAAESELATRRDRIHQHMTSRETLSERLSRLGYETAAFTPNPFTSRHFGFGQGFDRFEDFMDESTRGALYQRIFRGFLEGGGIASLARVAMNFWQREEVLKPWESYYDDVVSWVRDADEPYFLWVFLMDAHNPYMASSEYRSQSRLAQFRANLEFWRQSHETPFSETVHQRLVTAYDDAIRYADAFLAELRADLGDDVVYAVHGDPGEAFGEHGTYGHEPYLYRENVHVPLVVGNVDGGRVECPVSLRSLPGILTNVATGGDPSPPGTVPVLSRSRQGGRSAAHLPDGTYVRDAGEAVATGTLAGDVGEPLGAVLNRSDASLDERERIAAAAARTAQGESV